MKFKTITSNNEKDFTELLETEVEKLHVNYNKVEDIKYSLLPILAGGNSEGILYSALIIYKNV